jgi:hypothetical protein
LCLLLRVPTPLYYNVGLIGIRSYAASLIQRNNPIIKAALCSNIPVNYLKVGLAAFNSNGPYELISARAGRAGLLRWLWFATIKVEAVYTFGRKWY